MIKIDYIFTTSTPVHTGSDKNMGTLKSLRRQKIITPTLKIKANYDTENRRNAIVFLLYAVHKCIDFTNIKQHRLYKFWDEMSNKIQQASTAKNRFQFLELLTSLWGISSINDEKVIGVIENLTDDEFFNCIREDRIYILLKLKKAVKDKNSKYPQADKNIENTYTKSFEYIPIVAGNSIRGKLRRLLLKDFINLCTIEKLNKRIYHILFTGGVLDSSTQYIDIDKREEFLDMCPPINLLGAAIGNMIIEGQCAVGSALPICKELTTGENSFWDYIDVVFQTRLDDSKNFKNWTLIEKGKGVPTNQMKYAYEVFSKGTNFNHGFRMDDFNELITSCFYRMLILFVKNPIICGMWATGNAELDLSNLKKYIPDNGDYLYLKYIEENKVKIKTYFEDSV